MAKFKKAEEPIELEKEEKNLIQLEKEKGKIENIELIMFYRVRIEGNNNNFVATLECKSNETMF